MSTTLAPVPHRTRQRTVCVRTRENGRYRVRMSSVELAWISGADDALRNAYDEFGTLVFTYCVRATGDREVAADCTQETFVSAWRSRQRFDPERGSLAAWLMGIAKFRVVDHFRRQARNPAVPVVDVVDTAAAMTSSAADDDVADRLLVAHALDQLSARARQVVELGFYSDMTQAEIADKLGLPLGTVKSDMRRALLLLRRYVSTNEIDTKGVNADG